jgi:imidazolonepropionase-like amidohydrolase
VAAATSVLLRGRVIVHADDPVVEDGGLLIDRTGRVTAAGPWPTVRAEAAADVPVTDHRPYWLMPGLVDSHVHLTLAGDGSSGGQAYAEQSPEKLLLTAYRNALAALRAGVTALRDCGGRTSVVVALRDAIDEGLLPGPRLAVAGSPITITGGHCHYMGGEADGIDGVTRLARSLLKQRVDFLKMMGSGGGTPGTERMRTTFALDEVRAARAEAERVGTGVAVHATNRDATRLVVDAGVHTIEHGHMHTDAGPGFDDGLADRMADQGTIVSLTLPASVGTIRALERLAAIRPLQRDEEEHLSYLRRRQDAALSYAGRYAVRGVALACGTDAGWAATAFGDFAEGMEMLAAAGVRTREVLRAVTAVPARALGRADLGHLKPGAQGDVVVVRADPLDGVRAAREVEAVYLGGRLVQ